MVKIKKSTYNIIKWNIYLIIGFIIILSIIFFLIHLSNISQPQIQSEKYQPQQSQVIKSTGNNNINTNNDTTFDVNKLIDTLSSLGMLPFILLGIIFFIMFRNIIRSYY